MNYLRTIFRSHVSPNVPANLVAVRGTHQEKQCFRRRSLISRLLRSAKSAPLSKKLNCNVKRYHSNFYTDTLKKFNIDCSIKTKTIYGDSRNTSLLERKTFLDGSDHLDNSGTIIQAAGFKSVPDNRFKEIEREKEIKKSLKGNETKSSTHIHVDQEARSYAKLIANYSRAMEIDSFHTKSFDRSFGRANIMLSNSPFETVVASLSKIKRSKEAKIGSNLSTKSSSTPSPRHRRVRDFQSASDKNGSRSSSYSTDSGKNKEWMKKVGVAFNDLKDSGIKKDKKNLRNTTKLDEKDVLDCVEQQADWLDKVVKEHKILKMREINQTNEISTPDIEVRKTAIDPEKEGLLNKNFSKNMGTEHSILESFIREHAPCPIELSFTPMIDTLAYPTEMESTFEKETLIKKGNLIEKSETKLRFKTENLPEKSSVPENNASQSKSGSISINNSESSESSPPLNYIELGINSSPFSELKTIVTKNDEINVVSSADKIEIRIPITSLLTKHKTKNEDVKKIQKSISTLKLQISAKIEEQYVLNKDEHKSDLKNHQVKAEPRTEVKVVMNSANEKTTVKHHDLENSRSTWVPNKALPWQTQTQSENKSQKVLNFPKETHIPSVSGLEKLAESKDVNTRLQPSEVVEEDILKTNLNKTEKNLSLASKKLKEAAAFAESTIGKSVITSKGVVSKNLETPSTKSENMLKNTSLEDPKEVKIQKKMELDDNLTKKASPETGLDLHINRPKSRRRRKGTTVISRVIENELKKKNEQNILKDEKVATTLTTETKKNLPVTEALKPETKKTDQNTWTIDKVTKKTDEMIDQNVGEKLSDSVTVTKDETDKKVLDLSSSEMLKIKQKGQTVAQPPKKAIDATSATEDKLSEIKSRTQTSKIQLLGEKPHTFLNSFTKPDTKINEAHSKKAINYTGLGNTANTSDKKIESQTQNLTELEINKAKILPKDLNISSISGSNNKQNLNTDSEITSVKKSKALNSGKNNQTCFVSKVSLPMSPEGSIEIAEMLNKKDVLTKSSSTAHTESVKTKTETLENKDIPNELKPIEKKKDGTLIDYGLKVSSRKTVNQDFRESNSTEHKEQPTITAMIKEVMPKKEESVTSNNEKNHSSKSSFNALKLSSVNEKLAESQNKKEYIDQLSKSSKNSDNSLNIIRSDAPKTTLPVPMDKSVKYNSPKIKQEEKSAPISEPKGKNSLSINATSSDILLANTEESHWVAESLSKVKTTVLKMSLQLQEFEENHIFSGPDRHLQTKDS